MDPQQADYLRQISRKVDALLTRLDGRGVPDPAEPSASGLELGSHITRLASILDPQELLVAIMDSVIALTGAQRGFLMLVEEGNKLRFKVGRNVDQQTVGTQEFQTSRSLVKQVMHSGEAAHWDSTGGDPTSSQRLNNLKSVIVVPLKFSARSEGGARIAGVIYADSTGIANALGTGQMKLLNSLAEQAAVALENAQIFQKSERERAQIVRLKENIAKLYEVGRQISSTLILEDLLIAIVDNVVSIAQAQRGFVMLLEEDAQDAAAAKEAKKMGAAVQKSAKNVVFKVGRDARRQTLSEELFAFSTTIARKTIEGKKPQLLTSALGGEGDAASLSMVQMQLHSIICVPLIEKEEVIGLVYADSQQENKEFTDSDAEVLQSLCGQAAVAIVNAKLYQATADRERVKHELSLGAKIQADLLPKVIPPVDGLEMFGFMKPAKEVGGDYYDFIVHEGTKRSITIAIGDVSGKGVGAGIVMAMARSALRSHVQREKAPKSTLHLVQGLNNHMCGDIPRGMFMTINVLNWTAEDRKLRYTSAGHEHLLVYRARTRQVEKIKAGGTACGVLKQASALLQEKALDLAPGDHVLLYTDGVSEAMNSANEEFELDRLVEIVRTRGASSAKDLCEAIYQEIEVFRGEAEVHDDVTLVALRASPWAP